MSHRALELDLWLLTNPLLQSQKLREAIHTMLEMRAEALQHVQRMRILNTWARTIGQLSFLTYA